MDLMKGFARSLVNQVGRDTGKVVSNSLYGDAHSTPIRRIGSDNMSYHNKNGEICEISEQEFRNQIIEEGYHFSLRKTHPIFIVLGVLLSYIFLFVVGILFITRGALRICSRYSI